MRKTTFLAPNKRRTMLASSSTSRGRSNKWPRALASCLPSGSGGRRPLRLAQSFATDEGAPQPASVMAGPPHTGQQWGRLDGRTGGNGQDGGEHRCATAALSARRRKFATIIASGRTGKPFGRVHRVHLTRNYNINNLLCSGSQHRGCILLRLRPCQV